MLNKQFLPHGFWCFWGGAAITAGGLLFSVWARRHLGKNWSQAVTAKEGHELITRRRSILSRLNVGFTSSRKGWKHLLFGMSP